MGSVPQHFVTNTPQDIRKCCFKLEGDAKAGKARDFPRFSQISYRPFLWKSAAVENFLSGRGHYSTAAKETILWTLFETAHTNGIHWTSMLRSQDAHLFQFSSEKQALIYLCCSSSICAGFKILAGGTITFLLAAMVSKNTRVELAKCASELGIVPPCRTELSERGTFWGWVEIG